MILSSGIVPIRKTVQDYEYLILRCFKYWDFPKGELDGAEQPLDAAIRELKEETSLENVTFPWGKVSYETEVYSKGKTARYFLGEIHSPFDIKLLPNPESGMIEHHEFRWVTFHEGLTLVNPRIKKVFEWAQILLKSET